MSEILIIDDEPSVRSLFRQVLEEAGHHVIDVSSAKAGLRLLREHPVDLVLTDILMPDMDGLEVIRALHRDFPLVKVIAITGGQEQFDYCNVARLLGAHETLVKPVMIQRLLDTVTSVLQNPTHGQPSA